MGLYIKILLIVFGLAYLVSPMDIIPEILIPYLGWIDDGVVLATIFYMLKHGRLPEFVFRGKKPGFWQTFFRPRSTSDPSNTARQKQKSDPGRSTGNTSHQTERTEKTQTTSEAEPNPRLSPWEILGVDKYATKSQIQSAYKEAVKKYHPDKVSHLGEEFSTLANQKFLEIQDAYNTLMKQT